MKTFRDINLRPSRADLRSFRLIVLIGCALVGALMLLTRRGQAGIALFSAGGGIFVLSLVPLLARWLYVAWMALGIAMGKVTSPIVVSALWLALIVPLGLCFRLLGRDPMRRRSRDDDKTFWEPYPEHRDPKGLPSILRSVRMSKEVEKKGEGNTRTEFERAAHQGNASIVADFVQFLRHNKKWWLIPIVSMLLTVGAILILGGTAAAPFIYTLF